MMDVKSSIAILLAVSITTFFLIVLWENTNDNFVQMVKPFFDPSNFMGSSRINFSVAFNKTLDENIEPKDENNIFFHETFSIGEGEGLVLSSRLMCSVESAARMNPAKQIYLLLLSHDKFSSQTLEKLKVLTEYNNIAIRRISMVEYLKDTPLEEWWRTGIIESSSWPGIHTSDIARLISLWKFGGIYLDTDVLVMKSLENITNFVCAEDQSWLGNAVLGFSGTGVGKKVANACLSDMKENFQGSEWAYNGPRLITRVLLKLCGALSVAGIIGTNCQGFTIYPPSAFYPIHYDDWQLFFDKEKKLRTLERIQNAYAVHLWNSRSKGQRIEARSEVPYAILANKYCPKIYKKFGGDF